jgi:hypothetical protein
MLGRYTGRLQWVGALHHDSDLWLNMLEHQGDGPLFGRRVEGHADAQIYSLLEGEGIQGNGDRCFGEAAFQGDLLQLGEAAGEIRYVVELRKQVNGTHRFVCAVGEPVQASDQHLAPVNLLGDALAGRLDLLGLQRPSMF